MYAVQAQCGQNFGLSVEFAFVQQKTKVVFLVWLFT